MADSGGEDNPAFSNEEDSPSPSSKMESSKTESQQEKSYGNGRSLKGEESNKESSTNDQDGNAKKSFVSQHYVEPVRNGLESHSYKTETRIELPADDNGNKNNPLSPPSPVKVNGLNGNGNNNDASFLNTSATSIQTNDGKKEQIEAVNLELVSMRPYTANNVQTKGQEACELPADPYEEYFVPVNEHRKYMSSPNAEVETTVAGVRFDLGPGVGREGLSLRDPAAGLVDYSHWLKALRGEKLYVTKDKRSKSSYWRRMACWGFGLLVLAIALIIAILAGTGVILTQEASQPLEGQMNSQPFDDVKTAGSQEYIKNPPPSPPPETSTFPPWRTTDETIFETIPDALDGSMILDDLVWNDDLANSKSRVYRDVASQIENDLRQMLNPTSTMAMVKVYNISNDGEVLFRISYPPTSSPESVQNNIETMLRSNGNTVGKYHLGKLNVKKLINECQYESLGCSDLCEFDYSRGIFTCACSAGKVLDNSEKLCVFGYDLSNVDMDKESSTESTQDIVQGRSRAPESGFDPARPGDWMHQHLHTVTESISEPSNPEPSAEPKSEPEPSADEPKSEPEPLADESKSEPEPSTDEPKSEPEPSTDEPKSEPEPSVDEPKSEPEPSADEPKSEPEPSVNEPKSEPEPSTDKPKSESEPTKDEPKSEPEPSVIEPNAEPKSSVNEPKSEPEPSADEPKSEPEPTTDEPKSEPEPSTNEPKSEPAPKAEPETSVKEPKSEPEPSAAETKSMSESPVNEPRSKPELSVVEPRAEPEPSVDGPKAEPEPSADEPKAEPEPSADEPKAEPEPLADEPKAEPEPSADEPKAEPEPLANEPKAEPESSTDEPKAKQESSVNDPKSVPVPSVNEPKSEPEPSADEPKPVSEPKAEPESTAEPSPSAETKSETKTVKELESEPASLAESEPQSESELPVKSKIDEMTNSNEQSIEPEIVAVKNTDVESSTSIESDSKISVIAIPGDTDSKHEGHDNSTERSTKMSSEESSMKTLTDSEYEDIFKIFSEESTMNASTEDSIFSEGSMEDIGLQSGNVFPMEITTDLPSSLFQTNTPLVPSTESSTIDSSTIMPNLEIIESKFKNSEETEMEMDPVVATTFKMEIEEAADNGTSFKPEETTSLIDSNDSTSMPETMDRSIEKSKTSERNSTEIQDMENVMLIPVMISRDEGETSIVNETKQVSNGSSTMEGLDGSTTERATTRSTEKMELDEKHAEDMSPFLPEIFREKEMTKSPPRLDKDEQDFPNPFEPHVEDAVLNARPGHEETLNGSTVLAGNDSKEASDIPEKTTSQDEEMTTSSPAETSEEHGEEGSSDSPLGDRKFVEIEGKRPAEEDNSLNEADAKSDDLKLSESGDERSSNVTEATNKVEDSTIVPKEAIPDVVSLEETSTKIPQEEMKGIAEKSEVLTTTATSKDFSGGETEYQTGKPDYNARVEDQYNDIGDENIFENVHLNNEVTAHEEKESSKSEYEISTPRNFKMADEATVESSTLPEGFSLEPKMMEDAPRKNLSADDVKPKTEAEKAEEMNKLTTEVPIIPIEILQEISTTESSSKSEATGTTGSDVIVEDSTSIEKESSTETLSTITTTSSSETKTTAQVPILPEELQTTETVVSSTLNVTEKPENDVFSVPTTESVLSDQSSSTVPDDRTPEVAKTIKSNETEPMDSTTLKTKNETSEGVDDEESKPSSTLSPDDIKPVTELVLDDPEPMEFEFRHYFTTTEQTATEIPEEEEEEALKVIPLEEGVEFDRSSGEVPATVQAVGARSMEEKTTSGSSTTAVPNATEAEEKVASVPKLKIVEVTSISDQPRMTMTEDKPSETPKVRQHPIVIPVYEEVEDIQDPRTHPIVYATEASATSDPRTTLAGEQTTPKDSEKTTVTLTTGRPVTESSTELVPSESKNEKPEVAQTTLQIPLVSGFYSKCTTGQFQCVNGTSRDGAYCVSASAKCDSEKDCSDGSDENNCEEEHCLDNFQCKSGQCLARHLVCNGIKDCGDGSDEMECEKWACNFDEFRCPSGRCIPDLWRCDGRPDCEDHRDEYSCSESCGNDEYLCQTEKWCIPQTWRCNGVSECASGEDEKLCDCSLEQFKCRTGGCINAEQMCDGIEHCPDRSDEWNCLTANLTVARKEMVPSEDDPNGNIASQATLLKIRQSSEERRLVCSEGWNDELSDSYCQSLGFSGAESTQTVDYEGGQKVFGLRASSEPDSSLVSKLEPVDSCESGKVVKISCREFTCGAHETEGPTARLVGGTAAGEGQWSSVALLRELKHGVACTASVLGPVHALASYSCIHRLRQSNSWELFTGKDLQKSTMVKNIIPYPQVKYNQFLYNNDIALIELAEPLVFSRNVSAVCLPSQPFQPRALCVTAGWGFAANGEVNLKQYLKFLPVPTYDSEHCNATSHYAGFITKENICAGFTDADKGSCYNDEGAPLMCATENGRWEIQGLLSHHSRCSKVHPAIYSSLEPALSWLRNSVPALQVQT